jgi:surface polysaccharide O-acyltransferase-like enzyme
MNRVISLDIAKSICIILVVIGHYSPDNAPSLWILTHNLIYSFHMPLFMFASGYIYMVTYRKKSYSEFIFRKFKRLMIPYFATSVIIITLKLLSQKGLYVQHPVAFYTYLKIFYLPVAGYFLWFVWTLFEIFLIIPLFKSKRQRLLLFFIALIIHYLQFPTTDIFCVQEFKSMFIFFMLGVIIAEQKSLNQQAKLVPIYLPIVFFIIIYIFNLYIKLYIIDALLPYLGIYAVCNISRLINLHKSIIKRMLLLMTPYIYTIYLFHTTFEGFAKAILYKVHICTTYFILLPIDTSIIIFCGIAIPILLHKYILEKNRIAAYLLGIKYIKNNE